jgi:hypothetical protein
MEVDAVVCWCDTTDEEYKRYHQQDIGELVTEDTNRIGKRDELRFCLRGLYHNMPWLRKIYLVTWGKQFPKWLDEEESAKLNPPIIRIDQATLNNGKRMYGSLSVEACIHLIPNISEYFFYANSDMFVIKKMDRKDWFDENGVGKLSIGPGIHKTSHIRNRYNLGHWYKYGTLLQAELFLRKFGTPNFKFFQWTHHMTLISKQACKDTIAAFPELFEKTRNLKGREEKEYIGRLLFEYVGLQNGYMKLNPTPPYRWYLSHRSNYKMHLPKNVSLLCTNLNSILSPNKYDDYVRFMTNLLPKSLPSERFISYESNNYTQKGGRKTRKRRRS